MNKIDLSNKVILSNFRLLKISNLKYQKYYLNCMQLQKHQEQQTKNQPKPSTVSRPVFIALYLLGLVICIPTSLIIWFVRRRLFKETQVAGVNITPNLKEIH